MRKLNFNGRSSLDGDQSGNWKARVAALVAQKGGEKARDSSRPTSNRTKVEFNQNAQRVFGWLRKDLGFAGLSNPYHLCEKHFIALAGHIKAQKENGKFGAAMAAGYGTICRHLARWIDKPELIAVFNAELGKDVCKRSLIAERDKSWEAAGVNLEQKLIEVLSYERWVGLALICQHKFGMRKTEVLMFQPLADIRAVPIMPVPMVLNKKGVLVKQKINDLHWKEWVNGVNINIARGTKGKRPRVLCIDHDNDEVKETAWVIREQLKAWGDRDTLGPALFSLEENAGTYQRVLQKFGITQADLGITGHGLRAGFACNMLESYGITPTVRGGNGQHPDPAVQQKAYKETTEAMGHGRISVVGAYAGCITPQAAARLKKKLERQALREVLNGGSDTSSAQAKSSVNSSALEFINVNVKLP